MDSPQNGKSVSRDSIGVLMFFYRLMLIQEIFFGTVQTFGDANLEFFVVFLSESNQYLINRNKNK